MTDKKYLLVRSYTGHLADIEDQQCRVFDTYEEAFEVMRREALYDPEIDEEEVLNRVLIEERVACNEPSYRESTWWRIFEV